VICELFICLDVIAHIEYLLCKAFVASQLSVSANHLATSRQNIYTVRSIKDQYFVLLSNTSMVMGVGRAFSREGPLGDFSKFFLGGAKSGEIWFLPLETSDSVTRVMIFGHSDLTRVMLRKIVTQIDSSRVFHRMTRLESQSMIRDSSQSHSHKISEFLMDKPSSFAIKEISNFCISDDEDWRKFSALPVLSCYVTF